MVLVNAAIGIVQLILSLVFAVIALYIGFAVLSRITKGIDVEKELANGNVAVGILIAAVFFAIALVVQSGIAGISAGLSSALAVGVFSVGGVGMIGTAILQLVLGIVLAVIAIYIALNVLDKLTKGIEEFEEIKKGNVAVAVMMAGVIIAVAVILQSGVIGITNGLI